MYFTKVELQNFGIYKGTHEMHLVDRAGNRNITLVGGMNGRGKTTFHDAILIALYGKQAQKYINEKVRSYDKLLLDHINKYSAGQETYVAVSLILDDGTQLRVKRAWTAKGKKADQRILVEKNGIADKYLGESWDYYIEEILPFGIARFFFFDNEKITQLADDLSFEQIKASIKSAIGISTIEKAIVHTDEVIRRKKKALDEFEKSEINIGYREVETQLADLDRKLTEANEQEKLSGEKVDQINAALAARETEFWASGGDLIRNRDAIKLEMAHISAEVEQIHADVLRLAVDPSTPLYMCRELVVQSHDTEAELLSVESLDYVTKQVSKYREEILAGLDKLDLTQENLLAVKKLVHDILSPDSTQGASSSSQKHISPTSVMLYQRLISEVFQSVTQQINLLISREEAQENLRMSLDAHLGATDEKSLAMQLFDTLKSLEADKAVAEAAHARYQDTIKSLQRQREVLKAKQLQLLKAVAEREHSNDDNARIVRYAAMSIVVLTEFKMRLQREKVAKLSQAATDCFQTLVDKSSLISSIHIDPDSLDVTMYGTDGNEILKSQLSAGEQQMFAVSIIWALALTSGYKAPVVIDTPMARLDSSNRVNFVTKYLPAASSQVVVLSTDEEINGRYLDLIRNHVANYYTLLYNEEEQYTSIVSGYFKET